MVLSIDTKNVNNNDDDDEDEKRMYIKEKRTKNDEFVFLVC